MAVRDRAVAEPMTEGRSVWLPYHMPSIGEEEIAEVVDTLRSGWITTGPKTQQFERDFAAYLGVPEGLAVSSATAAMHLALVVLGVQPDDEVIVPTYTFTATGEVVTYLGARPVLVDVDPTTCNVTAATIERAITPKTRAIMVVHIAGLPCDMDPILALARHHGLAVVEDAAHALPARYRGRWVGTLGDASAFSFYATKNLTTGEGGMLLTKDPEALARGRVLALHGISRDAWKRYTASGNWYYEVLENGHKYNFTDMQASLGIHQLRKLDRLHAARVQIAERYRAGLAGLEALELPAAIPDTQHAWHLYLVRLRAGVLDIDRNAFIEELRTRNIGTSVHFIPLHLHPYYRRAFGYGPGDFPDAERAYEATVSLPLYPAMGKQDVDDVIAAVADVVDRHGR